MEVIDVNLQNIKLFSEVLIDAAEGLIISGQPMWEPANLPTQMLLKQYDIHYPPLGMQSSI